MKLRKYILQYKMKQIDTQYPYICVFHCSRGFSGTQWRRLKNVLYLSQGNTFILGSNKERLREQPIRSPRRGEGLMTPAISLDARDGAPKGACLTSFDYALRSSAHFCEPQQSEAKQVSVHEGTNPSALTTPTVGRGERSGESCFARPLASETQVNPNNFEAICRSAQYPFSQCTPSEQPLDLTLAHRPQTDEKKYSQFNTKLTNIAGPFCIVYSSIKIQDAADLNNSWLKLFKKIGHCEQNDNLILLYAQFKSTIVNHIDIKHAMNLERTSVLELFMRSLHSPGQSLDLCLNEGPLYLHLYL